MVTKIKEKYVKLQEDINKRVTTGKLGNLSLADYFAICNKGQELLIKHTCTTCIKNVADYFASFGFMVTMDFNNVNYVIVEA